MTASNNSRERLGWLTPGQWLFVGLLGMAMLGSAILRHYGEGVDEWHNAFFGWAFVHAYENYNLLTNPGIDYFNGPFFMMVWVVASQALHWAIPSWMLVDGRHFTTFLTFLAGVWFFYRLCLRFIPPRMALLTTVLFASQPVLFGHAFINQKDTPLMVFFLASVVVGWSAADRLMSVPHRGMMAAAPPRIGAPSVQVHVSSYRWASLRERRSCSISGSFTDCCTWVKASSEVHTRGNRCP